MKTARIVGKQPDNPSVLILTNERDISVDWVVRLLRANDLPYLRLNTERLLDYTLELSPLEGRALLHRNGKVFDLSRVSAVWYRRPDPPSGGPQLSSVEGSLIRAQWRTAVRGLVHILDARWMNHPGRNDDAEQKLLQLQTAQALGFSVPTTLVTTREAAVRRFERQHGSLIVKALDAPYIEDSEGTGRFVFTTRLRDAPPDLDGLEEAPLLFQPEISPKQDVRVTVVGDKVFGATVHGSVSPVDWRATPTPPPFVGHEVPAALAEGSVELVSQFGLLFGAIDFVVDESNTYWFLELNPNGEWGWLQKKAGLPIAEAIFAELTRG